MNRSVIPALALAALLGAGCLDPIVGYPCAPGLTACGELCVDLAASPAHCGACGNVCQGACAAGRCAAADAAPIDGRDAAADQRPDADDQRPDAADQRPDADAGDGGSLAPDGGDVGTSPDAPTGDAPPADGAAGVAGTDTGGSSADAPAPDVPGAATADAEPDGPLPDAPPDLTPPDTTPPDMLMCAVGELPCGGMCTPAQGDPDNCGACGNRCTSGLCTAGVCELQGAGHLVVIGHDYRVTRAGINHLVGNAVFLPGDPVSVLVYEGTAEAAAITGVNSAINQIAAERGRTWTRTTTSAAQLPMSLPGHDTLLILSQRGSDDLALVQLGLDWQAALNAFLTGGGAIVLLDGASPNNTGTFRIATAAGLFTSLARVEVTGQTLAVTSPGDAVALRVPRTYLAESTSVAFTTLDTVQVVQTMMGLPVVIHRTF